MVRRVYLEAPGRLHSVLRSLVDHPPNGYEIVVGLTAWDRAVARLTRSGIVYFGLHGSVMRKLIPVHLVKSLIESVTQRLPPDIDLVYAWGHLVFRRIPWIAEMEWVTQLVDYRLHSFYRWRRLIRNCLVSAFCRGIICRSNFNKEHVTRNLGQDLASKCIVIPQSVVSKSFTRRRTSNRTRILFVGSSNVPGGFEQKGGLILLEAFRYLREQYPSVELVVRSDLPDSAARYVGMPSLRLIDHPLSTVELEAEFLAADIFAVPAHSTPTVILEALSYGLPVVTTDVYENADFVRDGITGFLIPPSRIVRYYADEDRLMPDFDHPGYSKAIARIDDEMVCNLVHKLRLLVESEELRRTLGSAARKDIECGNFSLQRRNERLGSVFDRALGSGRNLTSVRIGEKA